MSTKDLSRAAESSVKAFATDEHNPQHPAHDQDVGLSTHEESQRIDDSLASLSQLSSNLPIPAGQSVPFGEPCIAVTATEGPASESSKMAQPEANPMSLKQLSADLKRIHVGLAMLANRLDSNAWQATLSAIHTQIVTDFLNLFDVEIRASAPSPMAVEAVERFANPYTWMHDRHAFFQWLQKRISRSPDALFLFIEKAYCTMDLHCLSSSLFQEEWVECLTMLERCRTVFEAGDSKTLPHMLSEFQESLAKDSFKQCIELFRWGLTEKSFSQLAKACQAKITEEPTWPLKEVWIELVPEECSGPIVEGSLKESIYRDYCEFGGEGKKSMIQWFREEFEKHMGEDPWSYKNTSTEPALANSLDKSIEGLSEEPDWRTYDGSQRCTDYRLRWVKSIMVEHVRDNLRMTVKDWQKMIETKCFELTRRFSFWRRALSGSICVPRSKDKAARLVNRAGLCCQSRRLSYPEACVSRAQNRTGNYFARGWFKAFLHYTRSKALLAFTWDEIDSGASQHHLTESNLLDSALNRLRLSNSVRDQTRTLNGLPTRKGLPMVIQGREIGAQHDTGAERGNFIAHDLSCKLKLRIRTGKSDCKLFSMGNGKVVRAIGRARALCAFAKEPCSRMKCWFYVFKDLASPLIMGAQFLKTTETMSKYVDRLEDCASWGPIIPNVNLIGSTEQSKRRLAAFIDGRYTHVNADSGSHLDLMSSTYVKMHGYRIDRRTECRKRVRLADNTVAETIGQTSATITLQDGSSYSKLFDILPQLTSEVLLGETTLEEIGAFTAHENSFVDVFADERFLELSVLGYLGKVNEFLVHHVRLRRRKTPAQQHCKLPLFQKSKVESVANPDLFSIARETARQCYDRKPTCTRLGS